MTPDDLDLYLASLGLEVEIVTDTGKRSYTVVRNFSVPTGSLAGRTSDVAIERPAGIPYTVPQAIHTRPALVPMGEHATQASNLGADWQYWSRRFRNVPPTPQLVWAHVITVLGEP